MLLRAMKIKFSTIIEYYIYKLWKLKFWSRFFTFPIYRAFRYTVHYLFPPKSTVNSGADCSLFLSLPWITFTELNNLVSFWPTLFIYRIYLNILIELYFGERDYLFINTDVWTFKASPVLYIWFIFMICGS